MSVNFHSLCPSINQSIHHPLYTTVPCPVSVHIHRRSRGQPSKQRKRDLRTRKRLLRFCSLVCSATSPAASCIAYFDLQRRVLPHWPRAGCLSYPILSIALTPVSAVCLGTSQFLRAPAHLTNPFYSSDSRFQPPLSSLSSLCGKDSPTLFFSPPHASRHQIGSCRIDQTNP